MYLILPLHISTSNAPPYGSPPYVPPPPYPPLYTPPVCPSEMGVAPINKILEFFYLEKRCFVIYVLLGLKIFFRIFFTDIFGYMDYLLYICRNELYMYTEKRTVKVILIAFIILMIGCGISDWSQGQDYQWALNSVLSFFIVGLVSLFGGLLNLIHKQG